MPLRRLIVALAGALALLFASLAAAVLIPATAAAESSGTPAGAGAVGGYLDLGAAHGCALQQDRVARCWGQGSSGRLGGGGLDDRLAAAGSAATSVALANVAAVATGNAHTCALITNGDVRCWGQGGSGQLGGRARDIRLDGAVDPLTGTDDATTVPLGGPASAIAAGGEFNCALMAGSGAVRCWGDGSAGALGDSATDNRLDGLVGPAGDEASTVPLGAAAVAITAGDQHACAILVGGAVRCWGSGANGRLGSGKTDDRLDGVIDPATGTDDASTVPLPAAAIAISAGSSHTCALLAGGDVACWGYGKFGQLGSGRNDDRLDGVMSTSGQTGKPTDDASIVALKPIGTAANKVATTANIPAIAIAAGDFHTCAIVSGGDVRCWGQGTAGQLGQGATDHRLDTSWNAVADAATRVGGGTAGTGPGLGSPAIALAAGWASTCAELASGAVRCWGDGTSGRLGSGATDARLDGVVDAGTATDDASIVPIAALPTTFLGDTPVPIPAGAGAAPAAGGGAPAAGAGGAAAPGAGGAGASAGVGAPAAVELSFSVKVKGQKATIAALVTPTKSGTCPKAIAAAATQAKVKLGRATLKVKKKGTACRAAGTLKLSRKAKKGKPISIALSGNGVRARTLAATA